MLQFCALEGGDGAGKSYLANQIVSYLKTTGHEGIVVAVKDQPYDDGSWIDQRLQGMHKLTWSYDNAEPVWEYSREYWLYSILAWYTLFYEKYVMPAINEGAVVITDGWCFKHQARFRLSGSPDLVDLADTLFARLPQPDLVVCLDAPPEVAAARKQGASKPSEHGAFDTGSGSLEQASLVTYQGNTKDALWQVLADHPATVQRVSHLITPEEVLGLIEQAKKA